MYLCWLLNQKLKLPTCIIDVFMPGECLTQNGSLNQNGLAIESRWIVALFFLGNVLYNLKGECNSLILCVIFW